MFKRLRNNMLIFNMVSISAVLIAAFCVVYIAAYRNAAKNNELRLNSVSSMFFEPNRPMPNGARKDMEFSDNNRFSPDYAVSFVLFVNDGTLEYIHSFLDYDNDAYAEALGLINDRETGRIKLEGKEWLFRVMPTRSPSNYGAARRVVFLDISDNQAMLSALLLTLCCASAVALSALFFISMRFANRAVKPIEDAYDKQKQFVADASHELRTPIAVIGANIDAIEVSGDETVASQKEWFDNIHSELKRTGGLIDELLYLAKSDNQKKENILPTDVSVACEMACVSFEAALYENNLKFETDIAERVTAYADADKFKQIVYILLDNAKKYTENGGKVALSLAASGKWAILKATNTAQIQRADLAKIFDRFYRPDEARSAEAGGAGLGLAIAKNIVERFGGEITADSRDGKTTFIVKLRAA